MGLILDSSVAIAAERRGDSVPALLRRIIDTAGDQEAAMSTAGVVELVHGIHRANTAERRARRETFVEDLLAAVVVYPLTTDIDSVATVRRLVTFYVDEHNHVLPHSACRGQTADEMYYGTGGAVPADLTLRAAAARHARVAPTDRRRAGPARLSTRSHDGRRAERRSDLSAPAKREHWLRPIRTGATRLLEVGTQPRERHRARPPRTAAEPLPGSGPPLFAALGARTRALKL